MEPRTVFAVTKTVLTGHFVYKSGRHGDKYVNKDLVYVFPEKLDHLCLAIYESVDHNAIDAVAGPAIGAALIAQLVARRISFLDVGRREECLAVYAEKEMGADGKETGKLVFKRGYDKFLRDRRVLVVEDVLTTGRSCRETIDAVRGAGGEVVAVRALWNLTGVTAEDLGVRNFKALIEENGYSAENCPLCAAGTTINTNVGHGAAFVAAHGQPQKQSGNP